MEFGILYKFGRNKMSISFFDDSTPFFVVVMRSSSIMLAFS
jgi:hypothetical protein